MKLAKVKIENQETYGLIKEEHFYEVTNNIKKKQPLLNDFISMINSDTVNVNKPESKFRSYFVGTGNLLTSIKFLAPVTDKNKIICVGINYPKLYNQILTKKPDNLILFSKFSETLVGTDELLQLPIGTAQQSFDYEGEIAIVIGKKGFKILEKDAYKHIFGFTLFNDGSVRDWQKHSIHAGKNFYRSSSCGPYIVTQDEIQRPNELNFQTKINGQIVQKATLKEMFFELSEIIAYISGIIPLNAGDIIATGSPEGTGASKTPAKFLKKGDHIEISSKLLGTLKNKVIDYS